MKNVELLLGDSNQILKNMDSESIDLIVTDIPYGIQYKSSRQCVDRKRSIKGEGNIEVRLPFFEKIKNDDTIQLLWLYDAFRILKNNSAIYIFIHRQNWCILESAVKEVGFKVKDMIVINKSNHGMGDLRGGYAPKYELVLFATKGRHLLSPGRINNVIDMPVKFSGSPRLHPNEKPISWAETFILKSSKPNDIILDPFMGSGFVGKAALKNNRKFMGIEIDEKYYKIALETITQLLTNQNNEI